MREHWLFRSPWKALVSKDVLTGLFFIAVAGVGLWMSRDYTMGTAQRMSTGYLPRIICGILFALGSVVLFQGLRDSESAEKMLDPRRWQAVVFVTLAIVVFGLMIESLGLVISALVMVACGSFAGHGLKPVEILVSAVFLVLLVVAIFVWGLNLVIPVWPEF